MDELKNYSIFPLIDKRPMAGFSWKKYQTQRATEEEINSWVENKIFNNFAIVTGDYNHILVVDLDVKEDGSYDKSIENKLPNTLIKKSLNGGFHFYYKYPSDLSIKVKNNFRDKVDIRATGSYVAYYQNDTSNPKFSNEIAEAPEWLLNELTTKNNMTEQKTITEPLSTLSLLNVGERNTGMTSKIGELLIMTEESMWSSLWPLIVGYNNALCNPPLEENELKRTFECLCKTEREKNISTFISMSTKEILNKTEKENPFLLEGLIVEGSINIMSSESGRGKSLVMLKMAQAIASGTPFLGEIKTKQAKTIIFDLEMSENDLIQRTHSIIQEDVENLRFIRLRKFDIEKDFNSLKKMISTENYKFVIFDTFSHIHRRKENDNDDMTRVMERVDDLTELGTTVLLLHHNRKPGINEKHGASSLRGAVAILGAQASCLMLDSETKLIEYNKKQYKGLNMSVNQEKKRQIKEAEPFTIDCFYDEETKKTTFIYIEGDKNASSAEKAKIYILNKMETGKEYIIEDFQPNGIGSNSIKTALTELHKDKKINSRNPEKGESLINGKKPNARRKIYSLKKTVS